MAWTSLRLFWPEGAGAADGRPSPTLPACLPRPLRGVLWDMSEICDDTAWQRWLLRLLKQIGLHNPRGSFRLLEREQLQAIHRGQQTFNEAFGDFLRSAGMSQGHIEELQSACRARRRTQEESLRPLPGVRSVVTRLAQAGFTVGAIGNSDLAAARLRQRLAQFGIAHLFAGVVSSIDVGHAMPEPECYETALEQMQLTADMVSFVGRNAAELAGASALGMATIAFNSDRDARADLYLGRLEEIMPALLRSVPPLASAG